MKTVLLAEDDENDIYLMKMACKRTGIPHELRVVKDGALAMDYLSGQREFADRSLFPMPDVVFLDINMPNCNGLEVLKWVRGQPGLKELPVVMLTSSTLPVDVNRAYELGVTSYLQKIANQGEFGQAVRIILKYWLELNIRSTI